VYGLDDAHRSRSGNVKNPYSYHVALAICSKYRAKVTFTKFLVTVNDSVKRGDGEFTRDDFHARKTLHGLQACLQKLTLQRLITDWEVL
jgi:hypothetical protein